MPLKYRCLIKMSNQIEPAYSQHTEKGEKDRTDSESDEEESPHFLASLDGIEQV